MQKIDVASAVPSLPAPAAAGTPGFFSDGNAVAGTPGTIVPADWLNLVMMEMVNIVLGVGAAPSKTTMTQLRDAMPKISGNSAIFPSGLIVNWGTGSHTDSSGAKAVTFATAFATGVLISIASNAAGGPPTAFHGTGAHSTTGMTVYSATSPGSPAASGVSFNWIAIGK